jgi:hypothetical protein
MNERSARCDRCRFWDTSAHQEEPDVAMRPCKRFPPLLVQTEWADAQTNATGNPSGGVWPETFGHDWCGEFEPIPVVT